MRTIQALNLVHEDDPPESLYIFGQASVALNDYKPQMILHFSGDRIHTLASNHPYTQEREHALKSLVQRLHRLGFTDEEIDGVLERQEMTYANNHD